MHAMDMDKIRREDMRWHLLGTLNLSRPVGMNTEPLLAVIKTVYPDATHREVRLALDYLEQRELVRIERDPLDHWWVELTRHGMDFVEYTIAAQPGISRPRITQV